MDSAEKTHTVCPGCGGHFPQIDGPTHPYMLSSAGCWQHYGQVLAREYEHRDLFADAHRLTVDAYALQHPGEPDERRSHQSVRLHYLSLHLMFKHHWNPQSATQALRSLSNREFAKLPEPPRRFDMTVLDVWHTDVTEHVAAVRRWAYAAYTAWSSLQSYANETLAPLAPK